MFGLFNKNPVLDDASAQWLFEVYAWALKNFDASVFRDHTELVLPTNKFFPGRVDSTHGMATLIFEKTREYAGMAHWPCRLLNQINLGTVPANQIRVQGTLRGPGGIIEKNVPEENQAIVPYDPSLINNPEAMVAVFAQTLAHFLTSMSPEPPPGGADNWALTTEVLGVFLGFGVMLSNTAKTHQVRSCASCGPTANRVSNLSQFDTTYALAIFSVLKSIPVKEVAKHLKPALRGYFKKAYKEIIRIKPDALLLGN